MKIVTLTFKISIPANPATLFTYLTEWENFTDWILFTRVAILSQTAQQVGTKLQSVTTIGPLSSIDGLVVTECVAAERIILEHTTRKYFNKGVFTIKQTSDATCLLIWQEITPVPFGYIGRAVLVIICPFLGIFYYASLHRLKKNIVSLNKK